MPIFPCMICIPTKIPTRFHPGQRRCVSFPCARRCVPFSNSPLCCLNRARNRAWCSRPRFRYQRFEIHSFHHLRRWLGCVQAWAAACNVPVVHAEFTFALTSQSPVSFPGHLLSVSTKSEYWTNFVELGVIGRGRFVTSAPTLE